MPRVTFNQTVKHGTSVFNEGDSVTVTQEEAEYFGSHGWLEGIPAAKNASPDATKILDSTTMPTQNIIPENPYVNEAPLNTELTVQNGTIGLEDDRG